MTVIEYNNLVKSGVVPTGFVHLNRIDYLINSVDKKLVPGSLCHIISIKSIPDRLFVRIGMDIRLKDYSEGKGIGSYTPFHLKS